MFLNLLQPSIVKFENSYDIPLILRNQYALNYNVIGIRWRTLDFPRLYFVISEKCDEANILNFVLSSIIDSELLYNGTKDFVPGVDYFLNDSLYNYFINSEEFNVIENPDIVLPDYLDESGNINYEIFSELCGCEADYTNLEYYYKKNQAINYKFTENELNKICMTFAKIILDLTNITEDNLLDPKNQSYKVVLEYFANGGTDCCTRLLQLILGNNFVSPNTISTLGSCGTCTSNSNDANGDSCYNLYVDGIKELFKSMLGDIEFYEDWFCTEIDKKFMPNTCLIQLIKDLLNEYLKNHTTTTYNNHCGCPRISNSEDSNADFDNYIKLLDYVLKCLMDSNKNKIKLFGTEFANKLLEICQY